MSAGAKSYRYLLFDADGTLFDFPRAEKAALTASCAQFCIAVGEKEVDAYRQINAGLWKQFERKEVAKKELQTRRFERFLDFLGRKEDPAALNAVYLKELSRRGDLLPDALGVCRTFAARGKRLAIITNGLSFTQRARFSPSPVMAYVSGGLFISEEIGAPKPDPRYFDYVLSHLGDPPKDEVLVIGDSLSADIAGGEAAGLDTCWFDPENVPPPQKPAPTFSVRTLRELPARVR